MEFLSSRVWMVVYHCDHEEKNWNITRWKSFIKTDDGRRSSFSIHLSSILSLTLTSPQMMSCLSLLSILFIHIDVFTSRLFMYIYYMNTDFQITFSSVFFLTPFLFLHSVLRSSCLSEQDFYLLIERHFSWARLKAEVRRLEVSPNLKLIVSKTNSLCVDVIIWNEQGIS